MSERVKNIPTSWETAYGDVVEEVIENIRDGIFDDIRGKQNTLFLKGESVDVDASVLEHLWILRDILDLVTDDSVGRQNIPVLNNIDIENRRPVINGLRSKGDVVRDPETGVDYCLSKIPGLVLAGEKIEEGDASTIRHYLRGINFVSEYVRDKLGLVGTSEQIE